MEARRRWFFLAFAGFIAWVAALAILAAFSARDNSSAVHKPSDHSSQR